MEDDKRLTQKEKEEIWGTKEEREKLKEQARRNCQMLRSIFDGTAKVVVKFEEI